MRDNPLDSLTEAEIGFDISLTLGIGDKKECCRFGNGVVDFASAIEAMDIIVFVKSVIFG